MESEETGESDETSKDAAHPQVTLSGLNSIVNLFKLCPSFISLTIHES